jgi:hypothetical protein
MLDIRFVRDALAEMARVVTLDRLLGLPWRLASATNVVRSQAWRALG